MRISTAIIPAFLPAFLLVLTAANCNGDEPVRSEFGEPCEPNGCEEGLACSGGYCEETCSVDSDCRPVEGWRHECYSGVCQIYCDDQGACPQTLASPLECISEWCAAIKDG